jgi:hypothetical protein
MLSTSLNAGTLRVGILDHNASDSAFREWYCDASGQSLKVPAVVQCASAKFQQCGACAMVVVQNNSGVSAEVKFEFTDAGFSEDIFPGAGMRAGPGCKSSDGAAGRPFAYDIDCDTVAPGKSCIQNIQFCPDRAEPSAARRK